MNIQTLGAIAYHFGVLLSIPTPVHSETNYQPYELVFDKPCNLPNNLVDKVDILYNPDDFVLELRYRIQKAHQDARKNLIKSKTLRKLTCDLNCKHRLYSKWDLILIKNESVNKMDKLFNGPYTVVEDVNPNVKIMKDNKIEIVHKNRTKLYHK